jgi:hypothetical protein
MSDAVKDFIAGTFGGMALVITGHPFDTLKVRLQTAPPGYFSSFGDCVKQTYTKEGVRFLPSPPSSRSCLRPKIASLTFGDLIS